jgi:ribonuclease HI
LIATVSLFLLGIGNETNNYYELLALKLVLLLALEKGISHIQIYGDSLLVIQWMKGDFSLHNFTLQPLFQDIMSNKSTFSHITFEHVYRNRNRKLTNYQKLDLPWEEESRKLLRALKLTPQNIYMTSGFNYDVLFDQTMFLCFYYEDYI